MKVTTAVALSEDLLAAIDERAPEYGDRSDLIETAVRDFLERTGEPEPKNATAELPWISKPMGVGVDISDKEALYAALDQG